MADGSTPFPDPSAPDPAPARIERQQAVLEQLASFGLDVAAAIAERARAAGPDEDLNALAMAYARAARAVRLTVMLQSRLAEAPGAPAQPAPREVDPLRAREDEAKDRVARIVHRVIAAEHDDERRIERLDDEACERLLDEDCHGAVLARPISEMVADICADLGLDPDWARLAREAWAVEEMRSGDVGRPLANLGAASPASGGGGPRSGGAGKPPPLSLDAPSVPP